VAPKIAENVDVQLPCMVNLDGFVLTHAIERMTTIDTQVIRDFVGEHRPLYPLLDVKHPVSHGNMDGPDYYYPHKYQSVIAMQKALGVCEDVFKQFKEISGREYHLVEEYKCDDAEYVAIILGSSFGTMKATVDLLREKGLKVGCAMPRVFRPWPAEALAKVMAGKKAVVVFDKHLSIGSYGPMFPEVVAAASDLDKLPKMYNVIYGLGGADATVSGFEKSYEAVVNGNAEKIHYLGVRL